MVEFDSAPAATGSSVKWWLLTIVVIAVGVAAIILIAVAAYLAKRFLPEKWLSNIGTIYPTGFLLWLLWSGYHQLYDKGRFDSLAVVFWFLAVGIASCLQANIFRRRISPGDVPLLGVTLLAAVTSFATLYYPHIKSSWGGGMPLKATIYFTKDSPLMPSQSAYVSLIDESSLGFYVVGPNDKQGTFIPRSSVAFIYFSGNSSGFFLPNHK